MQATPFRSLLVVEPLQAQLAAFPSLSVLTSVAPDLQVWTDSVREKATIKHVYLSRIVNLKKHVPWLLEATSHAPVLRVAFSRVYLVRQEIESVRERLV